MESGLVLSYDAQCNAASLPNEQWNGRTNVGTTTTTNGCDVLPTSMNGAVHSKGCPGAVWMNGNPSAHYCNGGGIDETQNSFRYPWWQECCTFVNNKCQIKTTPTTTTAAAAASTSTFKIN